MWGIDMSNVYLDDSILTNIADAIRAKTGNSAAITPANMATEITNLPSGGGSVTLNYLDGTQSPSRLSPDPYMTTILANRKFDDIKILVYRNEYSNSLIIIDKNTCIELTNVTYNNVSGKVYIPTSSIYYNTSYGIYTMTNITWGESIPKTVYNLFVPNNSTDCYWFVWKDATRTFNLSQKDTAFTLGGATSEEMIGMDLSNPYGGSFSSEVKNRFWIVEG